MNEAIRRLENGQYFVDYGPTTLVAQIKKNGQAVLGLEALIIEKIKELLSIISEAQGLLRVDVCHTWTEEEAKQVLRYYPEIIAKMVTATRTTGNKDLTPMATVAGGLSDQLADYLRQQTKADYVTVNNGGDIAIRLAKGQTLRLEILHGQDTDFCHKWRVDLKEDIRGVASSGLGGRSLTQGIANGVTVFSRSSCLADAWATHLANQSLVDNKAIHRVMASLVDPNTDIPELEVVTEVGDLSETAINKSMDQVKAHAQKAIAEDYIAGMIISVKDKTEQVTKNIAVFNEKTQASEKL